MKLLKGEISDGGFHDSILKSEVKPCLSAPYLSTTCTSISTYPTPKCTQTPKYIKIQIK